MLNETDNDLIIHLAGCTLAKKAGKNNWVEEDAVGGLPEYICRIARAVHRDGSHSVSQSIAIAVGRVRTWARGGGGVSAKTRAQAAKALAQWESKKKAAKLDNKVKASNVIFEDLDTRLTDAQLEKSAIVPCTAKVNLSLLESVALANKLKTEEVELLAFAADKPHLLELASRQFSQESRDKAASKGVALPDGSYPIPDKGALRRAIASYGRAKPEDRAKVKAHIKKRARALGATDMLPDGW